ncbi:MAG: RNHCP domain-containing protein [Candidatus Micrarchaeota archaeon]|nr:RNHCP domain-containing protein [Candidatus Micrarchaeota archaeon]
MAGKRFQRNREDFTCEWCGTRVKGTGYTDHCPNCLASKHVDTNPGDRSSNCGGKMEAVSSVYHGGEFVITYRCKKCGIEKRVGSAAGDNQDLLIVLATGRKGR